MPFDKNGRYVPTFQNRRKQVQDLQAKHAEENRVRMVQKALDFASQNRLTSEPDANLGFSNPETLRAPLPQKPFDRAKEFGSFPRRNPSTHGLGGRFASTFSQAPKAKPNELDGLKKIFMDMGDVAKQSFTPTKELKDAAKHDLMNPWHLIGMGESQVLKPAKDVLQEVVAEPPMQLVDRLKRGTEAAQQTEAERRSKRAPIAQQFGEDLNKLGEVGYTWAGGELLAPLKVLQGAKWLNKTGKGLAKGSLKAELPTVAATTAETGLTSLVNAGIVKGGIDYLEGANVADMQERNFAEKTGSSIRAGIGHTMELMGSAAKWMGYDNLGNDLRLEGGKAAAGFDIPNQEFTWKSFLDPDFYAVNVAKTIPTTLALMPLGLAGGAVGGVGATAVGVGALGRTIMQAIGASALSAPFEASLEAGAVYEEMRQRGATAEQANASADETFWNNMALLGVTNATEFATMFLPKGLGKSFDSAGARIGMGSAVGAFEEGAQSVIQQHAQGDPLNPSMEEMAIGGLIGGGMTSITAFHEAQDHIYSIQNDIINSLPDEDKADLQQALQDARAQGIPEEQAIRTALDVIAENKPDLVQAAVERRVESENQKQASKMKTGPWTPEMNAFMSDRSFTPTHIHRGNAVQAMETPYGSMIFKYQRGGGGEAKPESFKPLKQPKATETAPVEATAPVETVMDTATPAEEPLTAPAPQQEKPTAKNGAPASVGDTVELRGREGQKFTVTGISGDFVSLKSDKGGEIPQVHKSALIAVQSTQDVQAQDTPLDERQTDSMGGTALDLEVNEEMVDTSGDPATVMNKMREKLATSGKLSAQFKVKHLQAMKNYAEQNGLEWKPRYQELLEKFSEEAGINKQAKQDAKDAAQEAANRKEEQRKQEEEAVSKFRTRFVDEAKRHDSYDSFRQFSSGLEIPRGMRGSQSVESYLRDVYAEANGETPLAERNPLAGRVGETVTFEGPNGDQLTGIISSIIDDQLIGIDVPRPDGQGVFPYQGYSDDVTVVEQQAPAPEQKQEQLPENHEHWNVILRNLASGEWVRGDHLNKALERDGLKGVDRSLASMQLLRAGLLEETHNPKTGYVSQRITDKGRAFLNGETEQPTTEEDATVESPDFGKANGRIGYKVQKKNVLVTLDGQTYSFRHNDGFVTTRGSGLSVADAFDKLGVDIAEEMSLKSFLAELDKASKQPLVRRGDKVTWQMGTQTMSGEVRGLDGEGNAQVNLDGRALAVVTVPIDQLTVVPDENAMRWNKAKKEIRQQWATAAGANHPSTAEWSNLHVGQQEAIRRYFKQLDAEQQQPSAEIEETEESFEGNKPSNSEDNGKVEAPSRTEAFADVNENDEDQPEAEYPSGGVKLTTISVGTIVTPASSIYSGQVYKVDETFTHEFGGKRIKLINMKVTDSYHQDDVEESIDYGVVPEYYVLQKWDPSRPTAEMTKREVIGEFVDHFIKKFGLADKLNGNRNDAIEAFKKAAKGYAVYSDGLIIVADRGHIEFYKNGNVLEEKITNIRDLLREFVYKENIGGSVVKPDKKERTYEEVTFKPDKGDWSEAQRAAMEKLINAANKNGKMAVYLAFQKPDKDIIVTTMLRPPGTTRPLPMLELIERDGKTTHMDMDFDIESRGYLEVYRNDAVWPEGAKGGSANESQTTGASDSANLEGSQPQDVQLGDAVGNDSQSSGGNGAGNDQPGGSANGETSTTGGTGGTGTENGLDNQNGNGNSDEGTSVRPPRGNEQPRAADFVITDELDDLGGAKTKFKNNVAAIRLMREIEQEDRNATPDEQKVLAKYVGWGGIQEAFDERNIDSEKWGKEYAEMRDLVDSGVITQQEYESMSASTLNAHYTSPKVVRIMYDALARLGFKGGRVLEPSMGTGNFFGLMPQEMAANSQRVGVELDTVTGGIAKKLYPKASVNVKGFQKYEIADGYFDVAIGNVPFGGFGVTDASYNKKITERIHNYFFVKSLDKVRDGGIVMFITSSGTLNTRSNDTVRQEMAKRGNFLGAIRLPGDAFKANAGTEVTTDILIFQKRKEGEPENHAAPFVNTVKADVNGETFDENEYFYENRDMVLGDYVNDKLHPGRIGVKSDGRNIEEALSEAFQNLQADVYTDRVRDPQEFADQQQAVADSRGWRDVDSGAYYLENGKLMQRQGDIGVLAKLSADATARVKGMIPMRELVRKLIRQMMDPTVTDEQLAEPQKELNKLYDAFTKKFGPLNDSKNKELMRTDPIGSGVLMSIEHYEKDGKNVTTAKGGIFTKRTIKPSNPKDKADTAEEALVLSFFSKGKLDFQFMSQLTGKTQDQLIADLGERVFHNPGTNQWETADEYLSGNVRVKLLDAQQAAEKDSRYERNVKMLETVQPIDLQSDEIKVRIGSQWVPIKDYEDFINSILGTKNKVDVRYDVVSSKWTVKERESKSWYNGLHQNLRNTQEYGVNGKLTMLEIMQQSLNLSPAVVMTVEFDVHGIPRDVPHREQTAEAQNIQMQLQEMFEDWLWSDVEREARLTKAYNWTYNHTKLREYDGQLVYGDEKNSVQIPGLSEIYTLRPHQKDAVWRTLQGKNTLLAHVVGAGKTLEMVVSAMEMRRLGIANKPMIVVPNITFTQMYKEIYDAYPGAKVLRLTSDDVPSVKTSRSKKNTDEEYAKKQEKNRLERARILSQIATGDYDIILMSHEMFTRLPVSPERTLEHIRQQIADVMQAIKGAKDDQDQKTVKKLENAKRKLEEKLQRNLDEDKKDVVIPFEELGIDYLFVDEAHYYKNLYFHTKMQNVAGLSSRTVQRAEDMYLKTQWLSEVRNGGGVVFATGTPISNSMSEMFAMQRYLMGAELRNAGLAHFDAWAALFGETTTDFEMTASGKFKQRTRFAKFNNVPELLYQFFSFADVKTAEMLDLPKPTYVERETISVPLSNGQRAYLNDLVRRAENMQHVDKKDDNWLLLNTHGRMMAVDLRLVQAGVEDDPGSKLNAAVDQVVKVYNNKDIAKDKNGKRVDNHTQIMFLDLGTPKKDDDTEDDGEESGNSKKKKKSVAQATKEERLKAATEAEEKKFTALYHDIKQKLIKKGIPAHEIAFIHDAKTAEEKLTLSKRVNDGKIRVLLGSSMKAGVGLNVQKRLVALHHLDATWTPAGIEQREGRIIRQKNENDRVHIFTYVTAGSFDALSWDLLKVKATFIAQMMSGKLDVRNMEDVGTQVLGFAHIAGVALGNTLVKDKLEADKEVMRLTSLKTRFARNRRNAETVLVRKPEEIASDEKHIRNIDSDIAARKDTRGDAFEIELFGKTYDKRADADDVFMPLVEAQINKMKVDEIETIGAIGGFTIKLKKQSLKNFSKSFSLELIGPSGEYYYVNADSVQGLENGIYRAESRKTFYLDEIETAKQQIEDAKRIMEIQFEHEDALKEALRLQVDLERQIEQMNAAHDNALTSGDDEDADVEAETAATDESYKGATVQDRMAYDINAEKEGGVGIVAPGFGSRRRKRQSRIPQAPAHIEQQIRESRSITQPGLVHKIGARLTQFKNQLTREFEHLPKTPVYEPLRQKLLQLLGQKDVAKFKTYRINLQAITQKLEQEDFELFERKVMIDDQYEEMMRGGALNFEFTPQELEDHKNDIDAAVAQNPHVQEALRKRQQAWDEIKEDYFEVMESIGYNVRNKLTREHYFRRMVIQHAEELEKKAVAGGRVRQVRTPAGSGYLKGRSGSFSGNHITDYLVAEGEVMTQMIYDTAKARVIQFVDQKYNQMKRLKAEAKATNMATLEAIFENEKDDPNAQLDKHGDPISPTEKMYKSFNQKIAMGFDGLTKIDPDDLWQGTNGEYEDLVNELTAGRVKGMDTNPQTFPYLSQLAQRGDVGSMQAATILKGVADRRAFVEDVLGTAFVTEQRLAKQQGLKIWQPLPGSVFFRKNPQEDMAQVADDMFTLMMTSFGVPQEALNEMISKLNKAVGKEVIALGTRRKEFAILPEIALTLDNITDDPQYKGIHAGARWLTQKFKQAVLLSPNSVVKYNARNTSSDLEKTFAGNPKALKKVYQALYELAQVYYKGAAGTPELREYINRGGLANVQQVAEMGDIQYIKHFERFYEKNPNASVMLMSPFKGWWKLSRTATDFREAVLRYANYLSYMEQMQDNPLGKPDNYGASRGELVMALEDPRDRAYKLSNELLVDYQATGVIGKTMSDSGIYPFFRWVEGNFKSTTGLMMNAVRDERLAAAVGRKILGKLIFKSPYIAYRVTVNTGKLTIGLSVLAILLQLWNNLMFPDREKNLPEDVRNSMHIIWGVGPDGKTRYLDRLGFFEDYLGWLGLDNTISDFRKILDKERSVHETLDRNWHRWVNKGYGGVSPLVKAAIEVPSGLSTYPDVFHPTANQKWYEPILSMFSLRNEGKLLSEYLNDTPQPPKRLQNYLLGWVSLGSDPSEAAYYDVRDMIREFKVRNNLPLGNSANNEKRQSLYNFKLALRYGDEVAMEKYATDYFKLGGTVNGLRSSVDSLDPLYGMSQPMQAKFVAGLSKRQRELFDRSREFLHQELLGQGKNEVK